MIRVRNNIDGLDILNGVIAIFTLFRSLHLLKKFPGIDSEGHVYFNQLYGESIYILISIACANIWARPSLSNHVIPYLDENQKPLLHHSFCFDSVKDDGTPTKAH
jgi:hypothetical protein